MKNPQATKAETKPILIRLTKAETVQNAVQKRKTLPWIVAPLLQN